MRKLFLQRSILHVKDPILLNCKCHVQKNDFHHILMRMIVVFIFTLISDCTAMISVVSSSAHGFPTLEYAMVVFLRTTFLMHEL